MKLIWLPKLKAAKERSTEPPTLSQLACMAPVGGLVLIGMASAMLAVSAARPKESVARKLYTAEMKAQNMGQDGVDARSKPATREAPAGSHSGYPSTILTQGVVLTGPPGGIDQTPPLTTEPTLRRLGAESDARDQRHLSATRPHSEAASPNTKKRRRRSDSSFAAIGRALDFRIVRWLNKL